MIPMTRSVVRRSFGARASACTTAIDILTGAKSLKHLRESERNETIEVLRQSQEAWARMADPSVAGRIADILAEGMT